MSKHIHIGSVSIPLESYVISGTALLGTKGAGKTYAAKGIAEQLLDHEIPIIVFDPIGRWRFMKIAGDDAKKPRGYKVVVAGGEQPDLPLTPASAPEIVRAAIKENIPLVIDLYDRKLSKADWRRVIQSCFRTLLYENKGLRHIFLEETAEFAPQKVLDGETYAEVEKLVRMGGNASIGITLINQRAQEVNKAVLDLCDNLVLMRQRGSHAIDALEKWIDKLDPKSAQAIAAGMPHMVAGEAWVFTGSAEEATHVQTAAIRSFHPDRSKPQLTAEAEAARRADPAEFVAKLSGELEKIIAESEANDPKMLKKRIADLEQQLKGIGGLRPEETRAAQDTGYRRGIEDGLEAARQQFEALRKAAEQIDDLARDICGAGLTRLDHMPELPRWQPPTVKVTTHPPASSLKPVTRRALAQIAHAAARQVSTRLKPGIQQGQNGAGSPLTKAERLILTALAQYPAGRTKTQVAILSGYASTGGGFRNALSALRGKGYMEDGAGDLLCLTEAGRSALGPFERLPHGRALLDHWLAQLSKAERAALEALAGAYPDALSKEEIAQRAGYDAKGGGFRNALSRLRTLELIGGRGELRANEDLFG